MIVDDCAVTGVEHLQPFLFKAQRFGFFRLWLFMALLLHKCLLLEQTASHNLVIASEVKVEACLLLAELAELVPETHCPSYQKFKDMLSGLCEYCQKVCTKQGLLPFNQFKFQHAALSEDELNEIQNALKPLWVASKGPNMFHIYRCLDTATDFCFQLGARLDWESAAHLGCRFQDILGNMDRPMDGSDVIVVKERSVKWSQPYNPNAV